MWNVTWIGTGSGGDVNSLSPLDRLMSMLKGFDQKSVEFSIFLWRLSKELVNSVSILNQWRIPIPDCCVLCGEMGESRETVSHLFFNYEYIMLS